MRGALTTLRAYVTTLWASHRFRSRASFERWQARRLQNWLETAAPRVAACADLTARLDAFPIIDKRTVMDRFEAFNVAGITAAEGWTAFAGDRRIGPFTVGASTGTSGNRGLFVIDETERFTWLGVILAKALPSFWRRRERVAVILPLHTRLYEAANETRRLTMRFFDLGQPLESWIDALEAERPTVLIAPPKVLRRLAERRTSLRPRRVFSAAETLEPTDRRLIEARFGAPLHEIYMATEGLLGVTCRLGRMHLAEDAVHFEFEPVDAAGDLVTPIITHFRRTTQIMARYRMNDLLRLSPAPCPCGSPLRAVDEIVGRMDDVFHLPGATGPVMLTPDVLRNAVVDADRRIDDFRLHQASAEDVRLILPEALPEETLSAARHALEALFACHGARARLTVERAPLAPDPVRKLRRVENRSGERPRA